MMYQYPEKYKFTETWFDIAIQNWERLFPEFLKTHTIDSVLEIGCYEGRATTYLLDNFLKKDINYDIIDTFGGSLEESGMAKTGKKLKKDDFIYQNFKHNTSFHSEANFQIYRELSQLQLPKLLEENKTYDFIYIDASHRADDTFVDAYFAHKLLNLGGMIIFDDFGWKDPENLHASNSPELGIKMFFTNYGESYDIVMKGYQVGAIKKK